MGKVTVRCGHSMVYFASPKDAATYQLMMVGIAGGPILTEAQLASGAMLQATVQSQIELGGKAVMSLSTALCSSLVR